MASHFAYIASGALVGRGKITLLGLPSEEHNAGSQPAPTAIPGSGQNAAKGVKQINSRKMSDVRCLSAMRMSEVFERELMFCEAAASAAANGGAKASLGSSLSNMFGLGGKKDEDPVSGRDNESTELKMQRISAETVLKCRIALCPHKVRLAIWLADLGLTDAAYAYAVEAKALVQQSSLNEATSGKPPAKTGGKPPVPAAKGTGADGNAKGAGGGSPFSKGFINTLQEFMDRLSGGSNGGISFYTHIRILCCIGNILIVVFMCSRCGVIGIKIFYYRNFCIFLHFLCQ